MVILTTMIGLAILVIGRQLFWIFIAALVFMIGITYGEQLLINQPEWMLFAASSLVALLGALLAYTLQRFAGIAAGVAIGWYLTTLIFNYTNLDLGQAEKFVPIIVGILCGIFIWFFFDWGVIILSSMAGAAMIVSGMRFGNQTLLIFLIALSILGMAIQGMLYFQEDSKGR